MEKKMFCYQREQTDTAKLQDELTGALIALARAVDGAEIISPKTSQVILKGLFTTITNVSFDNAAIEKMIREVRVEKERLDYEDDEVNRFFCEALFRIGYEESVETLLPTVLKVGEIHLKCMALLDKANTEIC